MIAVMRLKEVPRPLWALGVVLAFFAALNCYRSHLSTFLASAVWLGLPTAACLYSLWPRMTAWSKEWTAGPKVALSQPEALKLNPVLVKALRSDFAAKLRNIGLPKDGFVSVPVFGGLWHRTVLVKADRWSLLHWNQGCERFFDGMFIAVWTDGHQCFTNPEYGKRRSSRCHLSPPAVVTKRVMVICPDELIPQKIRLQEALRPYFK